MVELYAPMFASENCVLFSLGAILAVTALGAFASSVFWLAIWKSPYRRKFLPTIAVGSSIFCLFGAYLFFTSETMVRVSTNWEMVEHRWCKMTRLVIDRYPIESIEEFRYRRQVDRDLNSRRERVSHYLDIIIRDRPKPIAISLDATSSEVNLENLRRLAPDAIAQYEASR